MIQHENFSICFISTGNIIIPHGYSDEEENIDIDSYNAMKSFCVRPDDTLELINYKRGYKLEWKNNREFKKDIGTEGEVDMTCVKEAISQMDSKKRVFNNQYGLVYSIIKAGLIGSTRKLLSPGTFLNEFPHISSSAFYDGLLQDGKIRSLMKNKDPDRQEKKQIDFINCFIDTYGQLKSSMQPQVQNPE